MTIESRSDAADSSSAVWAWQAHVRWDSGLLHATPRPRPPRPHCSTRINPTEASDAPTASSFLREAMTPTREPASSSKAQSIATVGARLFRRGTKGVETPRQGAGLLLQGTR